MSVCRARSLSLIGIDALPVEVEVDVSAGLPGFSIVGLPDAAVQEARERVRVAISGTDVPEGHPTGDAADPPGQMPGFGSHSDQSSLRALQEAGDSAFSDHKLNEVGQ